jgi:hypothetical protein
MITGLASHPLASANTIKARRSREVFSFLSAPGFTAAITKSLQGKIRRKKKVFF